MEGGRQGTHLEFSDTKASEKQNNNGITEDIWAKVEAELKVE